MRHIESRVQAACVRVFRLQHPTLARLYFSIPNGMAVSSTSQARIAVAEGLLKGAADTFLSVPASGLHGLYIEFKQEVEIWKGGKHTHAKTYQRPEQRDFEAAVLSAGYGYEVVRRVDEFVTLIDNYLSDKYERKQKD